MGYILFFLFAASLPANRCTMPTVPRRKREWNVLQLLLTAAAVLSAALLAAAVLAHWPR